MISETKMVRFDLCSILRRRVIFTFLMYFSLGSRAVESRKLFMMLVDGFRWDYFSMPGLELDGFSKLIRAGVKAEYMVPDFPTNSFPNYRSIETGAIKYYFITRI